MISFSACKQLVIISLNNMHDRHNNGDYAFFFLQNLDSLRQEGQYHLPFGGHLILKMIPFNSTLFIVTLSFHMVHYSSTKTWTCLHFHQYLVVHLLKGKGERGRGGKEEGGKKGGKE